MLTPLPESTHFCLGWNVNVEIQSLPQCSLTAETGTNCTLFCLISCHFVCRPIRNLVLSKGTFLAYFYLFTFKITPSSFFFFHYFICLTLAVSKLALIVVTYEAALQELICNPPLSCVARLQLIAQQVTFSAFFSQNFRKNAVLLH